MHNFIKRVVEEFREIAEDIVNEIKYKDDGQAVQMLSSLEQSMTSKKEQDKISTEISAQNRTIRLKEVELENLIREDIDGHMRTRIFVLRNTIFRMKSDLKDRVTELKILVNNETELWNSVMNKPIIKGRKISRQGMPETIDLVLG